MYLKIPKTPNLREDLSHLYNESPVAQSVPPVMRKLHKKGVHTSRPDKHFKNWVVTYLIFLAY